MKAGKKKGSEYRLTREAPFWSGQLLELVCLISLKIKAGYSIWPKQEAASIKRASAGEVTDLPSFCINPTGLSLKPTSPNREKLQYIVFPWTVKTCKKTEPALTQQ